MILAHYFYSPTYYTKYVKPTYTTNICRNLANLYVSCHLQYTAHCIVWCFAKESSSDTTITRKKNWFSIRLIEHINECFELDSALLYYFQNVGLIVRCIRYKYIADFVEPLHQMCDNTKVCQNNLTSDIYSTFTVRYSNNFWWHLIFQSIKMVVTNQTVKTFVHHTIFKKY